MFEKLCQSNYYEHKYLLKNFLKIIVFQNAYYMIQIKSNFYFDVVVYDQHWIGILCMFVRDLLQIYFSFI